MNNGFYNFPKTNQISAKSASYALTASYAVTSSYATTASYALTSNSPYKVYTALLTQNGGSVPTTMSSGELVIGTTYGISDNLQEPPFTWDFTNVGAPNNDIGTFFVATGTTPNSWGNGTLSYNTGAPIVTVLENTIGNIWFEYLGPGQYFIISDGLFTIHKTLGFAGTTFDGANAVTEPVVISCNGVLGCDPPNSIDLRLVGGDYNGDSLLSDTPIEIRVYN